MASTTKIMTALTALGTPNTNLNDRYTVIKEDLIGEASMGLRVGETVTFSDLLYGMLLNSGNDAAQAVARYAGSKIAGQGDPVSRFIARMNNQAEALGLKDSHYANPHGLDQDGHYSSAYDLAITGWYALHNPTIANIVSQQKATVAGHNLVNINNFLKRYSGANGIKPGFTDGAGLCLVASATRNGQTVIAVVLDTDQNGFTTDTAAILNYTFEMGKQPGQFQVAPPAGGGPSNSTAQYIGYPKGDVLLPATVAKTADNLGVNSGQNANVNPAFSGPGVGIAAQISTPPPGSPDDPTGGSGDGGNNNNKQSGGPNFLIILLIILIIGFVLFGLGRAGYLWGDTGKNIALQIEDGVVIGVRAGRQGLGRLFNMLKPGNHGEEPSTSDNQMPGFKPKPPAPNTDYRDRVNPNRGVQPTNSSGTGTAQNPARPRPSATDSSSYTIGRNSQPNPLEGFFDDVQPFSVEEGKFTSSPATNTYPPKSEPLIKPPQPISPLSSSAVPPSINRAPQPEKEAVQERPAVPKPTHPNRTATEPQQKPNLNAPADRLRPPQPLSPRPPSASIPPVTLPTDDKPVEPGQERRERNYFGSRAYGAGGADGLMARARQAIDYAYAGRLQASTDEFRKVVEQDPLFDFGSLEEFEQMPVLGYKALANAYSASGRQKFALLLLDMGIEKYPNDLELRNLMRTFKREIGQG